MSKREWSMWVVLLCYLGMGLCIVLALLFGGRECAAAEWPASKEGLQTTRQAKYTKKDRGVRMPAYYKHGSQRSYVLVAGGLLIERVWFDDRAKASAWAKEHSFSLVWVELTPQIEAKLRPLTENAKTQKGGAK